MPDPGAFHPDDVAILTQAPIDTNRAFEELAADRGVLLAQAPAGAGRGQRRGGAEAPSRFDEDAVASRTVVDAETADELSQLFARIGYSFDGVRDGRAPVPRVFVTQLPADLASLSSSDERKGLFFNVLLPMILHVNEQVLHDRNRLVSLAERRRAGMPLGYADRLWLDELAYYYELDEPDLDVLTRRVDVIPPSMALAQAAVESGWGTSGLAQQDNALFGQVAGSRAYAAFDEVYDSVQSYIHNLNTHHAYQQFRTVRSQRRSEGEDLSGYMLVGELRAYSELGSQYIQYVRSIIQANQLDLLDRAQLASAPLRPLEDGTRPGVEEGGG